MIVDGDWLRDSRLEDGPSLGRLISVSLTVLLSQWLTPHLTPGCPRAARKMKEVLATLASLLCSQVSMTLYSQSPSDLAGPGPTAGSENITAVQGESVIFRLTVLS